MRVYLRNPGLRGLELRGDPTIGDDPSRIPLLLGRVEHCRPRISDRRAGGVDREDGTLQVASYRTRARNGRRPALDAEEFVADGASRTLLSDVLRVGVRLQQRVDLGRIAWLYADHPARAVWIAIDKRRLL